MPFEKSSDQKGATDLCTFTEETCSVLFFEVRICFGVI